MNNELLIYIIKRLLQAVLTFFGIITIVFFIIHAIPADPIKISQGGMMAKSMDRSALEEVRKLYHLDKPVIEQYVLWLKRFFSFDFGVSIQDDRPVSEKILESVPVTLTLNIISLLTAFMIAIVVGVLNAARDGSVFDRVSSVLMFVLYALPGPWVALMLISFFGVQLELFPFYGLVSDDFQSLGFFEKVSDLASHLVLPLICYTYGSLAFMSRLTRGAMLDTMSRDFVKTAYAKGLSEPVVLIKHILRNSLIPIVTMFSTILPSLIGGSVIIENIFSIPGMGSLMFDSIRNFDYPVVMTVLSFSALLTLLNILAVDISYVFINPQVKFSNKGA